MSEVEELIAKYGPTFCVNPWKHFHICDTGVCKICCAASELLDENGNALSIYSAPLDDVWNSDRMRNIRRDMLRGAQIPECGTACSSVESAGGLSFRLRQNRQWDSGRIAQANVSIDDLKADAVKNNYYVSHKPFDLELEIDNTCNLSCRMCSADRSSRVERDHIHSQWSGRKYNLAAWDNNILEIAPKRLLQATYSGFEAVDSVAKQGTLSFFRWSEITLLNLKQTVSVIFLSFSLQFGKTNVRISVNGRVVFEDELTSGVQREIKIPLETYFDSFTLRFESDASRDFDDPLLKPFVSIEKIELLRVNDGACGKEFVFSRFQNKRHWMSEDEFVFGELLPRATQLQQIKLVGGEPLINTDALKILKYLASLDDPSKINVSFVTNGTTYNQEVFQIANRFKLMISAVSLDGVGHVNSYIRHGTNWESVIGNVRKMASSANVYVMVSCTLQAYNALVLSDLFRFCDQLNLPCFAIVVNSPRFLSMDVLPPKVRKIAAQRIREYAESPDGNPVTKAQAAGLARQLESAGPPFDAEQLRDFMRFTNDLDRSRVESVHEALPELVQLISDAGYPWIYEKKYF